MKRVIIESPYGLRSLPENSPAFIANLAYLKLCMRDSLDRGEAPFASHALYGMTRFLDDTIPEERALGIAAGFAWGIVAEMTAVYTDRGVSPGMEQGIKAAEAVGRPWVYRTVPGYKP